MLDFVPAQTSSFALSQCPSLPAPRWSTRDMSYLEDLLGPGPEGLLLATELIPFSHAEDPLSTQLLQERVHCPGKGAEVGVRSGPQPKDREPGERWHGCGHQTGRDVDISPSHTTMANTSMREHGGICFWQEYVIF